MKLINRDTDYAVRALCYISQRQEKPVAVTDLVKELGAPRPFLRKILQRLQLRGVLKSYKGKEGGFMLNQPTETIYLLDLLEVFHGPMNICECVFNKKMCPEVVSCLLKEKIGNIKDYVAKELKAITIASLVPQRKGV